MLYLQMVPIPHLSFPLRRGLLTSFSVQENETKTSKNIKWQGAELLPKLANYSIWPSDSVFYRVSFCLFVCSLSICLSVCLSVSLSLSTIRQGQKKERAIGGCFFLSVNTYWNPPHTHTTRPGKRQNSISEDLESESHARKAIIV